VNRTGPAFNRVECFSEAMTSADRRPDATVSLEGRMASEGVFKVASSRVVYESDLISGTGVS
ncbi:hypothetical protein KL953_36175, partial [Mycolicibacterium goodii]|nr:hypothetical protein [Mycolicibacterium goodii]